MEHFLHSLGDSILLFLILWVIFILFIISVIWSLLRTAIARGVEDGIYNAFISLKNNGIITDTISEMEETKQIFDTNTPPTEFEPQKSFTDKIYQYKNKEIEPLTAIPIIIITTGIIIGLYLLLSL